MVKLIPDGFDYSRMAVSSVSYASPGDQVDEYVSIWVLNVYALSVFNKRRPIISVR